jgi:hypothetical protein
MVVALRHLYLYQMNDEAAAFADSSIPLRLYEHSFNPQAA